jgi:hypothetical protein
MTITIVTSNNQSHEPRSTETSMPKKCAATTCNMHLASGSEGKNAALLPSYAKSVFFSASPSAL